MRTSKVIHVMSCHAEGEVGDVIVGGVTPPLGDTIWEQRSFIEQDDRMRRFVINEPRGGVFRHVTLLVPPEDPRAHVGWIIMEPADTPPMSGVERDLRGDRGAQHRNRSHGRHLAGHGKKHLLSLRDARHSWHQPTLRACLRGHPGAETEKPPKNDHFHPVIRNIAGWTVHIDPRMLEGEHAEAGGHAPPPADLHTRLPNVEY